MRGIAAFGCGQCLPCRLNRRRLWTHRLLLESFFHTEVSFVTLTYDQRCLPEGGSLDDKSTQRWLKRLRKFKKIRFYLVGEYGEHTQRPHYHAVLFGHGGCLRFPLAEQAFDRRSCSCQNCSLIRNTWGQGLTDCAHFSWQSAQYVCGYVTKKMTSDRTKVQQDYLQGRRPEFARMSRKPGIGVLAMEKLSEFVLSEVGANDLIETGDVPAVLRHGKQIAPLGRYLRSKLRAYCGFKEVNSQKEVLQKLEEEMRAMCEEALADPNNRSKTFGQILQEKSQQKILSLEARQKIFRKGKV